MSSTTISDEEVIGLVLNGKKSMYEILVRRYNERLYRIGRAIVKDDDEVEDIMQTAYLNAYVNLGRFKSKSTFSTWLTRILINESLLHKKKKSRTAEVSVEKQPLADPGKTPLTHLMNTELKKILETTIDSLPEKYRLVFVMREIEEMSTSETMDTLSLTESNVKVRLNRAKEMLRDQLSSQYRSSGVYDFHLKRCDRIAQHVMAQIETLPAEVR